MNSVHPTELSQIVILDTMQITMYRRSQAMAHTIVCIMVVSRTSDLSRHHSIISWSENSVSSSWTWWWCLGRYLHYIRRLIYLYLRLRTSAMNCSWIYNEGSNNNEINPFLLATWFYSLKMWVDDVWKSFFHPLFAIGSWGTECDYTAHSYSTIPIKVATTCTEGM